MSVAISDEMLNILCCPTSKQPVRQMTKEELDKINSLIAGGKITFRDGSTVDQQLQDGLITVDNSTIYRIDEDIPVMLVSAGILTSQVDGF